MPNTHNMADRETDIDFKSRDVFHHKGGYVVYDDI